MKVWCAVRNAGRGALEFVSRAKVAEELGFDVVSLSDHIVMPSKVGSRYPYSTGGGSPGDGSGVWLDAIVCMAYVLAGTTHIAVATNVLVLPLREPFALAKQVATLDAMSGGRIALGVGAGWLREEFEAIGVAFSSRGQRLEDSIDVLRQVWSGRVEYGAASLANSSGYLACEPHPVDRIPIIIGGSSVVALERAGRIGDGWSGLFSGMPSDDTVRQCVEMLSQAARSSGRDPQGIRRIVWLPGDCVECRPIMERAHRLGELGVGEVVLRPVDFGSRAALTDLVEQLHAIEPALV